MVILFLYILIGLVLTSIVDYRERKKDRGMQPLSFLISILGWPAFLAMVLLDHIRR